MKIANTCRVELLDSMGSDVAVADAARVSHAKTTSLDENGNLRTKDANLIGYLAEHGHWSPFGHVMATLRIAAPIFVARQWFRSTIGVSRNEASRRYVDSEPEFFLPDVIRSRPEGSIKQGSGGEHPAGGSWRHAIRDAHTDAVCLYRDMIADGVAPEQARAILPQATMTEWIETGSLAYFARVARLRLDGHAQEEIRDLMRLVADSIAPIAPRAWAALDAVG